MNITVCLDGGRRFYDSIVGFITILGWHNNHTDIRLIKH